jgi:hypothetical protein
MRASLPGQLDVTREPVTGHTSTDTPRSVPGGRRVLEFPSEFSQVPDTGVGLGTVPFGDSVSTTGLPYSS